MSQKTKTRKAMYFGAVQFQDIKTLQTHKVERILWVEGVLLDDREFKQYVLSKAKIKPKEQDKYRLTKLCTETAKHIGTTNPQ